MDNKGAWDRLCVIAEEVDNLATPEVRQLFVARCEQFALMVEMLDEAESMRAAGTFTAKFPGQTKGEEESDGEQEHRRRKIPRTLLTGFQTWEEHEHARRMCNDSPINPSS
jgi:hypothetical protein